MLDWEGVCSKNRKNFAISLIAIEIVVVVIYATHLRVNAEMGDQMTDNNTYYSMYQDVNVMMLIGFGFLMTFIKTHSWSALVYTFFINAVVVQLYLLFQPFWHHIMMNSWDEKYINVKESSFTAASYSVASILIAFGAVLGKVGPLELLIMGVIGIFGYTLNEDLVYSQLKLFDAGGSTAIHTFGAFYGIIVSFFLGRKTFCTREPKTSATSNSFAMIGTLFLWMYWPSFNAGYFPSTGFEKSLIASNTVLSLTGSCLGSFIVTSIMRDKFSMEDLLNASLAGGVIIGAPSGLIVNPLASILIGLLGGCISTICFNKLTEKLHRVLAIHDTCGVNNLHGLPGFFGGIISAIIFAFYGQADVNKDNLPWSLKVNIFQRTYHQQAGMQVAGTFLSAGIGMMTGIVTGIILINIYSYNDEKHFFEDSCHFEVEDENKNAFQEARQNESSLLIV